MGRPSGSIVLAAFLLASSCAPPPLRPFPDRPVAWEEHDDEDVPEKPAKTSWIQRRASHGLLELGPRAIDRHLSLRTPRPARDVNALDEVPCSTWYCPRNHLGQRLSLEAVAAGPGRVERPVLPLRVVEGKSAGKAFGMTAVDATGSKFLIKFDPLGHLGLATGAEMVGARLFHVAGYHVPDTFLVELSEAELVPDPGATYVVHGYETRPLTQARLGELLVGVPRAPSGLLRVVAVAFLPGKILGGIDFQGLHEGDPNDRIAHEDRRSLRASWVIDAWLAYFDAGANNTLASWVEEGGKRFVRHYVIDFGATLGSATEAPKSPEQGREHDVHVGRMLLSLGTLGAYRRDWQSDREAWTRAVARYPSVGWFPVEGFDPTGFRTGLTYAAHRAMTDRDAYWGAKVVTSIDDAQIRAAVATGGYPPEAAAYLEHALAARRDIVGRTYLTRVTAVESPAVDEDGSRVCFYDLAIARGAIDARRLRYAIRVTDGRGRELVRSRGEPRGPRGCVSFAPGEEGDYRVVSVTSMLDGQRLVPARVHLSFRRSAQRFVVVGLERDD